MPLVSVVMAVYNGEKYLAEAIESILGQTLTDFEFIIVDDASQDGSAAIIHEYLRRDTRVRLIQLEKNVGQAAAQNRAIAESRGEYIALMDCDDVSLPDRLRLKLEYLQGHPEIGIVGAGVQLVDQELQPISAKDYPLRHAEIVLRLLLLASAMSGAAILMRREVWEEVGPYERWPISTQDTEFYTRAVSKTRIANLPACLYLYRQHGNNLTVSNIPVRIDKAQTIRRRWLRRVEAKASPDFIDRLDWLSMGINLDWRERQLFRREVKQLLDALVAAQALLASDLPLIEAELNRRLEAMTPRLWQMFLHWRRHRFGSGKSEKAV